MSYMLVVVRFRTFRCLGIVEYYRNEDRVSNGIEIAFNGIVMLLYVDDILCYKVIDDSWGIGVSICDLFLYEFEFLNVFIVYYL
jgi:hypothetical protein